ncbi:hypothetical protein FOQG_04231 [Fusarium oxysporum f. sp. raphani 54005]|uniref:Uncharacterized protein n=1 Tax=Fusarium oxysporum f. sp. raphani 54005 TaxID=1089458 RepID=X0CIK0_FUSOX|nr:hypothetical protein FOQG_04231 [Fusarium oxysporum f. sp. raphani 54005]
MKGTPPMISAFKVKNSVAQWEEAAYMTPFKALCTRICTDMWVGRNKAIAHHQKQSAETYHEVLLNKNGQQAWLGEHRKHGCSDLPSRLACPTVARFAGISRSELDSQSWTSCTALLAQKKSQIGRGKPATSNAGFPVEVGRFDVVKSTRCRRP